MVTKRLRTVRTALVVIIALAFVLLGPGGALADDTGWKSPSDNAADTGGGFDNPENAHAEGGGYAEKDFEGGGEARHLYWKYNLGIPDCAIIDGIEVRLDWWLSYAGDISTMSVELSWDGGTSWTTAKTDSTQTTDTDHSAILGGPTDKWGRTQWTVDELSNDNFRVRVTATTDT